MKIFKILFLLAVLAVAVPTFAQQTDTRQFTLLVTAPTLSITTASPLPGGTALSPYSATIAATGGQPSYVFSISTGTLPSGLALSASTGVISGTPSTAGTSNFTVRVTDSQSPAVTATKSFSVVIASALSITTTTLPPAALGTAYTGTINFSGGVGPYTCSLSVGSLPSGLSVTASGSTCVISGTPSQAGSFSFTIKVSDSSPIGASIQVKGTSLIARLFNGRN